MDRIFEAIEEWMRNLLTGMVSSNLTTMYTDVNEKTGQIAAQVGQTPQGWNGSIYSMIQNLSESVIVPIAGMIITFVLCYELISMLTEKNNMHDIDTWMFFKYFFKMWVAVWIVSHTFTITMAVFDVWPHLCNPKLPHQLFSGKSAHLKVHRAFPAVCKPIPHRFQTHPFLRVSGHKIGLAVDRIAECIQRLCIVRM